MSKSTIKQTAFLVYHVFPTTTLCNPYIESIVMESEEQRVKLELVALWL
jgi:hypothetical protein